MHAIVANVTIEDFDASFAALREQVVPRITQASGFVTGYWTRKGNTGLSMVVFDSENAANAATEQWRSAMPDV